MCQLRLRAAHRFWLSGSRSFVVRMVCRGRVFLPLAGAASLLLGTVLVSAPVGAAASSTFAVTELQLGYYVGSVAADASNDTVYVAESNVDEVGVINAASDTVAAQISLPIRPAAVAVDQSSGTAYAIQTGSTTATADVINGTAVTASISLPSMASAFYAVANPVTHMVYVADVGNGTVTGSVVVIDGNTDTVAATIPLGDPVLAPNAHPIGLAVDAATNTVYVTDAGDDQLAVIDGATNAVTGRIDLPANSVPMGVAVDPTTGLVYVLDAGIGAVSVIDPATDSVSTLASGMPQPSLTAVPIEGLGLDTGTGTLYATIPASSANDDLGATYVIDEASGAITAQIPRGGSSVAVPASGGSAYLGGIVGTLGGYVPVITPSTANAMSPVITNPGLGSPSVTLTVGQAGEDQLTASATPAATFTETGTLPAGVSLSPSGLLSGTPAAGTGGTYGVTVTAANGVGPPWSTGLGLTVDEAPAITSANQVTFGAGLASSFTMTATGWPLATFSETGALPAGVSFVSDTLDEAGIAEGILSGTPAAGTAGVYPIQVTASNGVGTAATQAFTLTVTLTTPPAPSAAVGAEGTDGALWVQAPQLGAGWQSLGGQIAAAPAVVAAPNPNGATLASPLFFATAPNDELWMRSLTAGWQEVGPAGALCLGSPAAVMTGSAAPYTLTVACEGTNKALWYTSTTWSGTGLPTFTSGWTSPGGVLSAGPAVAPVGSLGQLNFFVLGTNGEVYDWTPIGFSPMTWDCIGSPAVGVQASTGYVTFACQGGDHALWQVTSTDGAWLGVQSLGGQLIGGPGVAATSQQLEYFAEGTDGAVWEWTSIGGWTSLGGIVIGGVGATALN